MKASVWLALNHSYTPGPRRWVGRNARGALSLPLALALLAASFMGFGTWGLMRHWRHLTELQIRLDRCVGDRALELKRALNRIEASNTRIRALRAAIAAGSLAGGSGQLMKPLLELEAAKQDVEILRWQARQAQWLAQRGCDGSADLPRPLPGMSWFRPPPDPIGSQPLDWMAKSGRSLKVQLAHAPRAAAALVEAGVGSEISGGWRVDGTWNASWTVPGFGTGHVRTSID